MTKVLVRKARDGPLPKPISEMSEEERERYGVASRADQRSGKALNIRGRKGVERIPSVPRVEEKEGQGPDYIEQGGRMVRVISRDPETGRVTRVADALHGDDYTEEEREAARRRHEKFMEEKGRALGRRRGDPAEFEDTESFETELTPGFRYGMDATARTDIDQPTGKKRRTITRNIEAGEEGSGFTERMLIRDPSGTHPFFGENVTGKKATRRGKESGGTFKPKYEANIRESLPLDKFLNKFLSRDFNGFQKLFAADPSVMRSLGRGKSMSQEERNQVVAEAMNSMRQNPDLLSQMMAMQGLEIEQDTSQMGGLGASKVGGMEDLVELGRQLRLSNPQALMVQELNDALAEQGLRMSPEQMADFARSANPQTLADVNEEMMSRIMQQAAPKAQPMQTSADEFGGTLLGRGKFVEPDPEKTVEIDPAQRQAQKDSAFEERLRNEFMILGAGDADSNPEGFQRFKNHINSKIDAQAEQVMRLQNQSGEATNITLDQAREMVMGGKEGFFSQAGMDNALESARVMAEQGMFDQEQEDDVYSGSMFDEMDAARAQSVRDAREARSGTLDELMSQKRMLQGIIEQQQDPMNPNSSPEQLEAFRRQLSMLNREISDARQEGNVHLGGRPTEAAPPDDISPQARRTAAAFRQGNVGVAGKDVQNLTGRSPDRTNAPLTIPGMEGEMSDSTFDRTVPDSKDERRGQRKREQGRRASGTDFGALGDAGTPAADPAAPAPAGGGAITAADILAQLGQMNVPAQPQNDDDDTVETGQWMSVGEQLLKGIEAHMFKSW